jgi:hypothetical protein
MWRKTAIVVLATNVVSGCSGAVHHLPSVDSSSLSLAQTEVRSGAGAPQRHDVSDDEARMALESALAKIQPAAKQLCSEMAVGPCDWRFVISTTIR